MLTYPPRYRYSHSHSHSLISQQPHGLLVLSSNLPLLILHFFLLYVFVLVLYPLIALFYSHWIYHPLLLRIIRI